MASETRQLPKSKVTLLSALETALAKDLATGSTILTGALRTRLTNITPGVRTRYDGIYPLKQALAALSLQKEGYDKVLQMMCSHFIQVFNLAVARGVFPVAHRAFYKLDVNSDAVPPIGKDSEVIQVAKDLIKGEADRVAAGGAVMTMPPIGDVQTAFNNFHNILMPHSQAVDALDTAQEFFDQLNPEPDAVVKKVWDEIETYYNEELPASQRQNARQWGVVYVLKGSEKTVRGRVIDNVTNKPIPGAKVHFKNGNITVVADAEADGQAYFELSTTLMGAQDIEAEEDLHQDYSAPLTLVENENLDGVVIRMMPV